MSALIKKIYEDYINNFGQAKANSWLESYQATTQNTLKTEGNNPQKTLNRHKGTKSLIRPNEVHRDQIESNANSIAVTVRQESPPVIPPSTTQALSQRPSLEEALDKQAWTTERFKTFECSHKDITQQANDLIERLPQNLSELSHQLVSFTQDELSKTAYRLYSLVHELALNVAARRGYAAKVSQVTFFSPLEVIAKALRRNRTTIWRRLQELHELGYVATRPHYTTYRGKTIIDGTIWAIKINPKRGSSARLSYEDLKTKYRNLSQDIEDGRTAYNVKIGVMQQSSIHKDRQALIQDLLAWTLPPQNIDSPVTNDCCKTDLLQVLDVPHVEKNAKSHAVDHAAHAISSALGDSGSINFYRQLLWQLLRRNAMSTNNGDEFQALYDEVKRAQADVIEGFAKKGGAILVSRLKQWINWDDIRQTPMIRIAKNPL